MNMKFKQGVRDKVITVEFKLSWYELQMIVIALHNPPSESATIQNLTGMFKHAFDECEEPR